MRWFEALESFVQLAKTRNFGRAAQLLGVTTPSLSRRIQALEREMGYTLVQRSTRSFKLTEQGRQLLARAESLVAEAATLKLDLAQSSKQLSGPVRIGAPVDLAITVLGPVLAEFCREHPFVTLNLLATQGQPDMQADQFDLAFVVVHQRPMPDSAFTLSRIGVFSRMLFASADYIMRQPLLEAPKELANHSCVLHFDQKPETYWDLRSGSKRARVFVSGMCATTSLTNAAQAARAGLGIAILPIHLVNPLSKGSLIRVLPDWEGVPASVFAVTARNNRLARVSALLEWIRKHVPYRIAELERMESES